MTDPAQTFKLLGPDGAIIMQGALSSVMEHLPDTSARNDALGTMLDTAVKQVAAEEQLEQAKACAVKILADGVTRLSARIDQFEKARSLAAKRVEAARKEAAQRQVQRYMDEEWDDPDEPYSIDPAERQASMRDQDPEGAIPPPADPTGAVLKDVAKDAGLEEEVTATRQTTNLPAQKSKSSSQLVHQFGER
jgi:hypothetical protein